MPTQYTLRMQFGPHEDPAAVTAQLETLARESLVDELMFFFFAEEQNDGHETLEQLQQWIERSRPYRDWAKKAGIQVSLNPWHSLLHTDRGRRLKAGQNWQTMVDPNGHAAEAVVCFLDPAWQVYFYETLRRYAAEGFRVVWIDDDIRYHNHAPLDWGGCFCPLHIAEFNRRMGTAASRAEIVAACLAPGEPHPWREAWMDLWQDTVLNFLTHCREILNASGTEMGLMSSSMESHGAEGRRWADWWKAFGGGKAPEKPLSGFSDRKPALFAGLLKHRPHHWTYSDSTGPMLIHGIAALDQNRSIQPAEIETGPEIENFPYGRWNKSFRQTFAQMAVGQILGSTNLNISLYDFMGNRPDDEPERAAFLHAARANLDWLAEMFPMHMRSAGVGVPWSEDLGRKVHTEVGKSWFELQTPTRGWAYWFGAAGLAFSARAQPEVNAIAGPQAWAFSEAELRRWLAAGLLLDGCAAKILVERGLGDLIGAQSGRWITHADALYSIEALSDARFALRGGAQISVNERPHTLRLFQAGLAQGAEVISKLLDPRQREVGHGAYIFNNALGGRVGVVPWSAADSSTAQMDIHRATQLRRLAGWLAKGSETGRVEGGAWLAAQFLRAGEHWRGAIWNAGPDEVEEIRVYRPAGMAEIQQAWQLTWRGERIAVPVDGDVLRPSKPLYEWDLIVI